jgi:sugar lactone lactonase YvrE
MGLRVAGIALVLAAVVASAASGARPALRQPYDVLALPNGHLIVSDLPAGKVYDVDPAHRSGRLVARIRDARELARLADGRVLVTSHERVLALDLRTRKTTLYATAANYILGLALAPDGGLYVSENVPGQEATTIAHLKDGARDVLADGLDGVHGILVTPDGLILGESYAGRLLRLDPATHVVTVLAGGMKYSGFAVTAAAGGWFVSELGRNRISHVWPDGHLTKVADVFQPGPIAFDARHRIVGVSQNGSVFRIERGRARTIYP